MSVAAAFVVGGFCVSAAPAWAAEDDEPRLMLFSGRDVWRQGLFAYAGTAWAPGGINEDGLRLKILLSGGLYRYYAGSLGEDVTGAEWLAALMPG